MAQKTRSTRKKKPNYSKRARRLQRELLYSFFLLMAVIILLAQFHSAPAHYRLVVFQEDGEVDTVQYYTSFKTAQREMNKLIERGEFNPAVLDEEENIIAIKYGIVNFRTKTCGENTSFKNDYNGRKGYTNGCYGADGAYLETDDKGKHVKFKQSGVVGWVNRSDVEIYNYFDQSKVKSVNHYTLEQKSLVHHISTNLKKNSYASAINIGEPRTKLKEKKYYSYDGNYFYRSYTQMIDDYRSDTYENSENYKEPYFNYYQYLSHRAKTSYVSKDINAYINQTLGFTAKPSGYPCAQNESQLFNEGYSFIEAQNTYGVNAMMMLSLAINESGFGKSQIAIEKNNLFGHAAYDNAPNASANGYKDIAAGIATHASIFLNQGYLNPCDQSDPNEIGSPSSCFNQSGNRYLGGYFGDKGSGMNVKYASDPYWGEKAALYYRTMDELLGEKDKTRYTIKVLSDQPETPCYSQPDTGSKTLFYTPPSEHYAVIVLGEVKGEEVDGNNVWYKIQSDAVLTNARNAVITAPKNYNHNSDIIYLPAAYFK